MPKEETTNWGGVGWGGPLGKFIKNKFKKKKLKGKKNPWLAINKNRWGGGFNGKFFIWTQFRFISIGC